MHLSRINNYTRILLEEPELALGFLLGRLAPGYFRAHYKRKAVQQGLSKSYFILSFDCDTEKDIEVVEDVHHRLVQIGITPTYAVPGELLERGRDTYSRLKNAGAEFINHGYVSHTSYITHTRSYVSTVFYDKLSKSEVRTDVLRGHEVCMEILGEAPIGFRTPHFGTYQKTPQLEYLYTVLSELGYVFSSSTVPVAAMWNGPIIQTGMGIFEFPVNGCYDFPERILDSWGFRFSPTRRFCEADYVTQFKKMVTHFSRPGQVGILNIYADPSQVYDWSGFFDCMAMAQDLCNITFRGLVKEVSA